MRVQIQVQGAIPQRPPRLQLQSGQRQNTVGRVRSSYHVEHSGLFKPIAQYDARLQSALALGSQEVRGHQLCGHEAQQLERHKSQFVL